MNARVWWTLIALACVARSASVHADTAIYRCSVNGTTTFSDRPCSEGAQPVTLDTSRVSTFAPVPAGKVELTKSKRPKARTAGPALNATRERCARIEAGLGKIADQQRVGYGVAEGIRLEERKRSLREERRQLKC